MRDVKEQERGRQTCEMREEREELIKKRKKKKLLLFKPTGVNKKIIKFLRFCYSVILLLEWYCSMS